MQHPFAALAPEYANLLRLMTVTQPAAVNIVARKLLQNRARYQAVATVTGVPAAFLAVLHERESDADFSTNLAQGDPLTRPSTHVPAGRPKLLPGMSFPVTWEFAAEDAIAFDHLNDNSAPWSVLYAIWKGEAWNGFGPRHHGRHSGYLWAGTNIYTGGKYVADGIWDASAFDKQLGIVPVMLRIIELDPSLSFGDEPPMIHGPSVIPVPLPEPIGVGGGVYDTRWIQHALNVLGQTPKLLEDASYGRRTRDAVRTWQAAHGLDPDGLAGPETVAALKQAIG